MIQMSRKAWNNVVIFSMLLMIFFLNGLHYKLNPTDEKMGIQAVLPAQSFILTVAFPGYKIERIGTSWRIELPKGATQSYSVSELSAMVSSWQKAQLNVVEKPPQLGEALSVARIWLATHELPLSFQLYQHSNRLILFDKHKQRWFELDEAQVRALFLPILFRQQEI
ncbi:hypothetical protein HUZ36_07600 [Pseudoalteromonas sp. McH1-7]|uniref:hypothetical protein n=1 Tax=Pseudoalteromonas TaxID=53246 RepID=UPI001591A95C|nr:MULTISPECIES: hypothetical protein [Pseudoalteromonas]MDW7549463.1 hypothetical protein [Pseudoalteromonas peptidolytica]NUZ10639.1 hypothetical protein [Pseudoalteromonas sp. McH1-7]USD29108.1 hypothetical protein J8Z24_03160 [Pseudoalteromonas sp. SCSIO 43201]